MILDWTTTHCRCILDDCFHGRPAKSQDISSNKHLCDLLGCKVRKLNGVNSYMDLERALHKKCNRIPMTVIHRLISSRKRRCVDDLGSTEFITDTE